MYSDAINHCGVYLMVSEISGAVYVGGSQNFRKRWNFHRWHLRAGAHPYQKHFEKAFQQGKLLFVLLEQPKRSALKKAEQKWMDCFPQRVNIERKSTHHGNKNGAYYTRSPQHLAALHAGYQKNIKKIKAALSAAHKGVSRTFSEEQKKHISEAIQRLNRKRDKHGRFSH